MAAPTSDERREVAWMLRTEVSEGECIDYAVCRIINDVLGVNGAWGAKAARILADLIDPTCHVVGTTSEEGLYDGLTIFRHELSCGHTCETVWLEPPAYCDVCGARVVDDG
jgi:hypothetical protein